MQRGNRHGEQEGGGELLRAAPELQLALVVQERSSDSVDSSAGRFGVRRGTTAEEFLRQGLGDEPVTVSESNEDLYNAFSRGELNAIVDDSPIAMHFAPSITGLSYRAPYLDTDGEYAIMVAKENHALKTEIDSELSRLEEDGVLASLRQRWFGHPSILVACNLHGA